MKYCLLLLLLTSCFACTPDKTPTIKELFPVVGQLPIELNELSGLLHESDQSLIGHNDSGADPILYEFEFDNQTLNRQVVITNVDAIDWEDITEDEAFIYVGDFGNNSGSREDLVVYKIDKNDFKNQDSIEAQAIRFYYPEQNDFAPGDKHNFDCEAIICVRDQLYLFSKNRENAKTDLYRLPKTPGTYPAEYVATFEAEGLITGASIYLKDKRTLALIGVESNEGAQPFVWLFYDFEGDQFFSGQHKKVELPLEGKMEAICFLNASQLIFSREGIGEQLFTLDLEDWIP